MRNNKGQTMLHNAVKFGSFEIVKTLINAGADIDAQDVCLISIQNKGNTAAHYANKYGYNHILDFLLSMRANEKILNNNGNTIWEVAKVNIN